MNHQKASPTHKLKHTHICDECVKKMKKMKKGRTFVFCEKCAKEVEHNFFECNECLQKYWYVTRYGN